MSAKGYDIIVEILTEKQRPLTRKEIGREIRRKAGVNAVCRQSAIQVLSRVKHNNFLKCIVYCPDFLPLDYFGLESWLENGTLKLQYKNIIDEIN